MTECDHSNGKYLVSDPDIENKYWPIVFDEQPKEGVVKNVKCAVCDEKVEVVYRIEEIADESEVVWERD